MPLAVLQCCCSGPGLVRVALAFLYHPDDDPGILGVPCWMSPDPQFNIFDPTDYPSNHIMGYDCDRNWIIFTPPTFYGFLGAFSGTPGAINYSDFSSCSFSEPMPTVELIDITTANTILDVASAEAPEFASVLSAWSCISKPLDGEYRLYGWTRWFPFGGTVGEDNHFKAWSVDYEGGDYTEHISLTGKFISTMSVQQGDIITCESDGIGSGTGSIRVNGAVVAGGIKGAHEFTTGAKNGGGAVGMRVAPNFSPPPFVYWTFVDDSEDGLWLAFTADGNNYLFGGASLSWNEKLGGLMILWVRYDLTIPLPDGYPDSFVSLSTSALSPGNVIGQEGTKIYAARPFRYLFGALNAAIDWDHPVTIGSMPRPIDLTSWEPPEPPEPPPLGPNCNEYDAIEDFTGSLYVTIDQFQNCTIPDNEGDHNFEEIRTWSNVNQVNTGILILDPASTFGTPGVLQCVSGAKGNFYLPVIDYFSTADWNTRYANPGAPWQNDIDFEITREENYVVGYGIEIACDNEDEETPGEVYIKRLEIVTQRFGFVWNTGDNDYTDPYSGLAIPLRCWDFDQIVYKSGAQINEEGHTGAGQMTTVFKYDYCGEEKHFRVSANIGEIV